MKSYSESACVSSGSVPAPCARLRPYEVIATPPITLVLYAIAERCRVGGSLAPGVRALAEWANVSPGIVSPCLYQLAEDGWITYDGRVIMLLADPEACAIPEVAEGAEDSDHGRDRSLAEEPITAVITLAEHASDHGRDRTFSRSEPSDLFRDRFDSAMVLNQQQILDSKPVVVKPKIPCGAENDHGRDRSPPAEPAQAEPPAATLMAELGAHRAIIAEAFAARPEWTVAEVRDRYAYDCKRIAAAPDRLHLGVFFTALRLGEVAPIVRSAELDPAAYAGQDGYMLGGQAEASAEVPESIGDIARRILPADASTADWVFVQTRLARGSAEGDALAALAARRVVR